MEYFIKASAVMALFYICYKLLLQKETFFQSNRWFLLIGLIIAVIFPFVVIPEYIIIESIDATQNNSLLEVSTATDLSILEEESPYELKKIISILYSIGFTFFFILFLLQFGSLILLLIKNPKNKEGIYTYILVKSDISPFSFFKWIVYNPEQFNNEELQLILDHERVHVRQYHSIDILITQLISVIFWFNPFIWLYKKDVQQNLEYIADDEAQTINKDEKKYQKLLLKTSIKNYDTTLISNFYNSLIKKRIVMLHKSKSKAIKQWKIAIIIPLLTIFLMSVNKKKVFIEKENTLIVNAEARETIEFIVTKNTTDIELNDMVKMVEAKGGILNFSDIVRNSKDELTGIFVSFYNHSYGGNQGKPIDSFIIYKELFENEGGFVGRIEGATMHFKDYDNATDDDIEKLQKRAEKVIIKSGIQNQNNLKKSSNKDQASKKLTNKLIEVVFTKNTTEESFKKHKKWLKENNVSFNVKQLKRNNKGEISTINIDFITKNGTTNYNVSNNDGKPINDFKFYMKDDGEFGIASIKNKRKSFFSASKIAADSISVEGDIVKLYGNSKIQYDNINLNTNTLSNINYDSIESDLDIIETFKNKNPLYILDGKPISAKKAQRLKQEDIASINIIKDETAIKIYGKSAKNGVVVIVSKKYSKINFNNSEVESDTQQEKLEITTPQDKKPLYVIDGKVVDQETFEKLKNENIQTINVFKDKAGIELYGEAAKYGVIVVRTKDNVSPIYILNGKIITSTEAKKLEAAGKIKSLEIIHHKKQFIKEKYNIDTEGDIIIIETKEKTNNDN